MFKERDKKFEAKGLEKVQSLIEKGLYQGVNLTDAKAFVKKKLRENERERTERADGIAERTEIREDKKIELKKWAIVIAGLTLVVLAISLYFTLNK